MKMCPRRCAHCVSSLLFCLAVISIAASILLLFPNGETEYLKEAHITCQALLLPGLWGSGFMVFLAALSIHNAATDRCCCFCTSTRVKMFVSIIWSKLVIVSSCICLGISALGLANGPLCLFNVSVSNNTQVQHWGTPFNTSSMIASPDCYLYNPSLWEICERPKNVVLWNIILFLILIIISCLQVLLCTLQIINGYFGCVFGRCLHANTK
ncbi:transmembrane 4 L6 family member 5-like [Stegostoma tigrinum]|uniref:transmembrane 4 L6 family member 5-like n=1 Tax=Stegostoma tigrinum TaxID=3053191 RepID=UPI00202B3968|nr:transmembrane 4 L6 family member 5-like [Stegostoma tigrinum]